MNERDRILLLSDEELARECTLDFYKGSGNGGQKRNKCSTAARVIHPATGCSATDCSERSQHRNRHNALNKLRRNIAFQHRHTPADRPTALPVSAKHPGYYQYLAQLLDILTDNRFDRKLAAEFLEISPSRLDKLLRTDPNLFQEVQIRERTLKNAKNPLPELENP